MHDSDHQYRDAETGEFITWEAAEASPATTVRETKPGPSPLDQMFELQRQLQIEAYGKDPADITDPEERIQFIKDMHTAIGSELQEFLDETGWKPWATSRHVNEEAAQGELVDAFHFFMNLCMAVNLTPDLLVQKYIKKRLKNIKRQQEGYDGLKGKCPVCKRALDDEGVACTEKVCVA